MFKYTTINCIYILYRICAHGNSQVAWGIYKDFRSTDQLISIQFLHLLLKICICPFSRAICWHVLAKDLIEAMAPSTDNLLLKHRIV